MCFPVTQQQKDVTLSSKCMQIFLRSLTIGKDFKVRTRSGVIIIQLLSYLGKQLTQH